MPHKRAKRSAREADRAAQGTDNAPTSKNEGVLAGQNAKYGGLSAKMYRILNAETIRKEKKERDALKRKREEAADNEDASTSTPAGEQSSKATKKLKIMPGEKLKNFNARVEESMRADVSSAIRQSKSARKKNKLSRAAAAKAAAEAEEAALHKPPPRRDDTGKLKERASDFGSRETVKLNDVAMEPPSLKFGAKSTSKVLAAKSKKALPVSMKQKQELEDERERAIQQYRDIKARQLAQREQ